MSETRVLCLCCGTRYDVDGDCPWLNVEPHSAALARLVALYLLTQDIDAPTRDDVLVARQAIKDEARALIESARLEE
jgi:hypothetical protein